VRGIAQKKKKGGIQFCAREVRYETGKKARKEKLPFPLKTRGEKGEKSIRRKGSLCQGEVVGKKRANPLKKKGKKKKCTIARCCVKKRKNGEKEGSRILNKEKRKKQRG